jgi:hypothetical protein
MAISDILFCQCGVTEFLVKENNTDADNFGLLCCLYGAACMGISNVRRWVKLYKMKSWMFRETSVQVDLGHHAIEEVMATLIYWKVCLPLACG